MMACGRKIAQYLRVFGRAHTCPRFDFDDDRTEIDEIHSIVTAQSTAFEGHVAWNLGDVAQRPDALGLD